MRDRIATIKQKVTKPGLGLRLTLVFLFVTWLGIVIFTIINHEFWRDEVRSFSLSKNATSLVDLYYLLKHDGHPILWHLVLFIGTHILDSNLILPVSSLAIATAAIIIFLKFSPFPIWFKAIFMFCGFPLYEYSVMARPYGLSMLLLFITACVFRYREQHPIWLAVVLALLANTNVHSVILVGLVFLNWVLEDLLNPKKKSSLTIKRMIIPGVIVGTGIILNLIFTLPRADSIVIKIPSGIDFEQVILSVVQFIFLPNATFSKLFPSWVSPFWSLIIMVLVLLGLIKKPRLILITILSQIAFGVLFFFVYEGDYRHQGLFLVFLIFLYWITRSQESNTSDSVKKGALVKIGFIAITIMILMNCFIGINLVYEDIYQIRSSGKQLGEFLNHSALYKNAIIVAEPDYSMESLPYYADNQIFFPRENRFGQTVQWTAESSESISITDLLLTAQQVRRIYDEPVLIVLGHFEINQTTSGSKEFSYNKTFTWESKELSTFLSSTKLIAVFDDAYTDENYMVFVLK